MQIIDNTGTRHVFSSEFKELISKWELYIKNAIKKMNQNINIDNENENSISNTVNENKEDDNEHENKNDESSKLSEKSKSEKVTLQSFKIDQLIGKGSFGKVFKVTRKDTLDV